MIRLRLPYPPSINHYWRRRGTRIYLADKGREYRKQVWAILREQRVVTLTGPVQLSIRLWLPDKRRRDVDNVLKALLDALEHGKAINDDSQIWRLQVEKIQGTQPGAVEVDLEQIEV